MNSLDTDEQGDSEGFGITFLEANACGKPVIGTNVGGISDAIENNVNGILVKPNDVNATAEAIIQLFSDQSLYQKLSGNGLRRVNNQFSLSNVGGKYHQIISSLSSSY
jgi:phosphatidylinositol alpha-1,6-mannosyltransferase